MDGVPAPDLRGFIRQIMGIVLALLAYASWPAMAAHAATPDFGPNVLVFNPSMPAAAIQKAIDGVYSTQQHNEFDLNAMLFLFLLATTM